MPWTAAVGITFGCLVPMAAVSALALAIATLAKSANAGVAVGLLSWAVVVLVTQSTSGQLASAMTGSALLAYLTVTACCAAGLPGGEADVLLRNVAGLTGIGLACAALLGGIMSWACPLAYTVIAEYALTASWHTALLWPARPPHDLPAALCADVVFLAGATLITPEQRS